MEESKINGLMALQAGVFMFGFLVGKGIAEDSELAMFAKMLKAAGAESTYIDEYAEKKL
jgi:hypothetical protein